MSDEVKSETERVPGGWTAAVLLAAIGFAALFAGGVWLLYPLARHPHEPPPKAFSGPKLEAAPVNDYNAYISRQRALLAGAEGRTPIEDAMAGVVKRGTLEPEAAQ